MIYKCKNCGGNVVYHPDMKKMYCPHCDGTDSEEEVRTTAVAENGEEAKSSAVTECANCGAPLEVSPYTSACKCAHCGSYMILEERVEGECTPHLILPFQISKEKAVKLLEKEFQSRYFTPGTFLSAATLEGMEGIYVPFFLYDYLATFDYAGMGTKVRSWRSGNTEYVETSYFRVERNIDIDFDGIPVDASINMDDTKMDLLEPFDGNALIEFQKKYMSGFQGERFSENLMDLEPRAQEKARRDSEELLRETLSGYTTLQAERKHLNLQRQSAAYALLPVWVYYYSYHGKKYTYYVNGQSGKVLGKTPVSKGKMFAYGGAAWVFASSMLLLLKMILEVL